MDTFLNKHLVQSQIIKDHN